MFGTLLATGLVVVGAGSALSFVPRAFRARARGPGARHRRRREWPASRCSPPGSELGASFTSELEPRLGVDPLSGYFLFVLGMVGRPPSSSPRATSHPTHADAITAALTGVFLLVLALVLCARDPLTFLAAWELMTLVPAAIILVGTARPGGPELGVRLHRAHAPDGRGHLDRGAAARRRRRVRRRRRDRGGLRARRSRSRSPHSSAWGRKPGSCRCTRGCRARTRSLPRTCRR